MLGSITPLGERGRNQRWGRTVTAYIVGTTMGGALVGTALAAGGAVTYRLLPAIPTYGIVAVLGIFGIALDLRLFRLRLPSIQRQVDDEWLYRYRGWVYGFGFGFQLGLGFVTIVTISSTYLTYAFAFLTGNAGLGAAIGAVFGFTRGATLLAAFDVRDPRRLMRLDGRLNRWDAVSRRVAVAAEVALVIAVLASV